MLSQVPSKIIKPRKLPNAYGENLAKTGTHCRKNRDSLLLIGFRKLADMVRKTSPESAAKFDAEAQIAEAVHVYFLSVANQANFVLVRDAGDTETMRRIVQDELELVKAFFPVVKVDSHISFGASNHYYYVPIDLAEKVINCCDVLERSAK